MSFRQIKSPALADKAVIDTKLDESAVQGQSALTGMVDPSQCFTLLYDVGSDSLKKIASDDFFGSFSTSDLTEGSNLYFTDARAQTAVAQDIADAVAVETSRATTAEGALQTAIDAEVTRATAAEQANATAISNEVTRATTREDAIESGYQSADAALSLRIDNILSNTDETALNSLAEIVTAFQDADDVLTASTIANSTAISNEVTRATAAEQANATAISTETTRAQTVEADLQAQITAEAAARVAGDNALGVRLTTEEGNVDQLQIDLAAEVSRATAAEAVIAQDLADEVSRATAAEAANASSIQDEITARAVADTAVRTDMTALINSGDAATLASAKAHDDLLIGDATVDGTSGNTVTDRIATAKAEAIADADASVAAEQAAREAADSDLQAGLDAEIARATAAEGVNSVAIADESTRAQGEESRIEAKVDNIISNTDPAALDSLTEIVAAFESADSDMSALIASNTTAISNEATARSSADSVLQSNIDTEASTRAAADVALQADIDTNKADYIARDAVVAANAAADATSKANTAKAEAIAHADAQDTALIGDASVDGSAGNTITARIATAKSEATAYTDSQVSAEAATRQAADDSLGLRVTALEGEMDSNESDIDALQSDLATEVAARIAGDNTLQGNIDAEESARIAADTTLTNDLAAEVTRATNAEAANALAISNEVTRATGVEAGLRTDTDANTVGVATNATNLSNEITRAQAAESGLQTQITAEVNRATSAEAALAAADSDEQVARIAGDAALRADVDANAGDIAGLDSDLSAEIARAVAAEGQIASDLADEISRATAAEQANSDAIAAEVTRATGIEAGLRTDVDANALDIVGLDSDLNAEIARATAAELANSQAISAETTRATGVESGLRTDVDAVTTRVDNIIGTSPETLDTLQEIVAAFEDADSDLQAVISANSGRLTTNEGDIDALEIRATDLESRASLVEGRATDLETEQSAQAGRLTVNEGDIDDLETKVGTATLQTVATDLSAAINEIHSELDVEAGHVDTLQSEMDAVEERATTLEGEMDAVEGRATALEGRATVNEGDIDDLEAKVGTGTLNTTATDLSAAINEIHGELDVEAGHVDVLQSEMDAVEGRATVLEGRADGHDSDIAAHAVRLTTNEADIDALEVKVGSGAFDTTAQTVVGSINEVHGEVDAAVARIDGHDSDVSSLQAQVTAEVNRATNQEGLIRSEFAAEDTAIRGEFAAADAVVQAAAAADATSKANTAEANAKLYADGIVGDEETARENADTVLQSAIDTEAATRASADAALSNRATVLETEMTATQAGAGLTTAGDYVVPTGTNYIDPTVSLADADLKLDAAIGAEVSRATGVELGLQTQITNEVAARIAGDSDLQASIASEIARATGVESDQAALIQANADALVVESNARQTADANLQSQIDFIKENTDSAALDSLTEIVAAFQSADGTLTGLVSQNQTDIATNASGLAQEISDRAAQGAAIRAEFAAADAAQDIVIDGKVAKAGDTMSGILNMGSNKIQDLAAGTVSSDAVNKGQLDTGLAAQHISVFSTTDLSEGDNLYYTDARSRAAFSVTDVDGEGNVSYDASTGVLSVSSGKAFVELEDVVESTITGKEGYVARVKTDGSGIELVDPNELNFNDAKRQVMNGDGSQTVFALDFVTQEANAMVFVGGVIQDPSTHYSIDSANQTITFNSAIPVGTQAVVIAQAPRSVGVLDPGSVGVETFASNVKPSVQGNDIVVGTSSTVVSSFIASDVRAAKFIVTVDLNGEHEVRECMVIHDGTTAYINEFGIVYTGNAMLGDTDVQISNGVVELTYQAVSAGAVVKVVKTSVDV